MKLFYEQIKLVIMMMMKFRLLQHLIIYLFKINDRRTRGPLILSEKHRNT